MFYKDWQIWLGCFLLFASGAIVSMLASGSEMMLWLASLVRTERVATTDVVELLSYVATIALAGVALATVRSWKKQTLYARRYDAFVRLNVALQDLDVFRTWAKALPDSHYRRYTKEADDESDQVNFDYISRLMNRIPEVWREYRLAVYEAALHMDPADLEPCLAVKYVRDNLLTPTRDLYNDLESNYSGRRLSNDDWNRMAGNIEVTCFYVRLTCDEVIEAGERYIFRQLRPNV